MPEPAAPQAKYIVALLCLLFTFSFVDRLIPSLLAKGMQQQIPMTDTQLGLLIGTSFAVVYSLAGLPLAHCLDRYNRKRILVAGVLTWGGATVATALASNLTELTLLRAGVALGEAVLTPAAVSMIADLFPRERRVLPMALYAAVSALMGIGGLVFGAAALQLAEQLGAEVGMAAWRVTMVLVGIPPMLLGLLVAATVREPVRGRFDPVATAQSDASTGDFLRHLRDNMRFYLPFYAATALIVIYSFSVMTWTPTLMIRAHGAAPAEAGYLFGLVGMGAGLLGAAFWPHLTVRLAQRHWRDPVIAGLALGSVLGGPVLIGAPLAPDRNLLLAGLGLTIFSLSAFGTLSPLAVQTYGPPRLRARLMALVLLSQNLIGYGVGPPLVAMIAMRWPQDEMALGYALSIVALVVTPTAAICYILSRQALARRPLIL